MKIDCILTSCNSNKNYLDFIPIFIKAWKYILPGSSVKIILILEEIPKKFIQYKKNIILFKPIAGISSAFISQNIRTLYPAILPFKNGVLISDIDMIPLSQNYYTQTIKNLQNNSFVSYRNCLEASKEIAICYNIATPKIWSEIFHIKNEKDIKDRLESLCKKVQYDDKIGSPSWSTDQVYLYKHIANWKKQGNRYISFSDNETQFNRLCRASFSFNEGMLEKIKNGFYVDYHMKRPHEKHKKVNNLIVEQLNNSTVY